MRFRFKKDFYLIYLPDRSLRVHRFPLVAGEFLFPSHESAFVHCRIESSFFQLFSASEWSTSSTSMRAMNYQRCLIQEFWKTIFTLKKLQEIRERIWRKTSSSVWEWLITACKWAMGTCKTFLTPKSVKLPSRSRSPKIKNSGSLNVPLRHSTKKNIGMFQGSFWNYDG